MWQDQFKYSYPPLPDDDFQSPICENGPIVSEDESDIKDIESESKETLESSFNSEQSIKPKKVYHISSCSYAAFCLIYVCLFTNPGHISPKIKRNYILISLLQRILHTHVFCILVMRIRPENVFNPIKPTNF